MNLPSDPPPSTPLPAPPTRWTLFWTSMLRLVMFVVLSVLLWVGLMWLLRAVPGLESELAISTLALLPAVAAATLFLVTIADSQSLAAVGLPLDRLGLRHLIFGTIAGSLLCVSIEGIQWMMGWVDVEFASVEGSLVEVLWAPSIPAGFFVLFSGAAGEELLFRGYGLQQLMRATHPWGAVIFSSVLFGVVHANNPEFSKVAMVNTALFGALFGIALLRFRSLWIPSGLHFGWNFSTVCLGANLSGLTIRMTSMEIVPVGPAHWSGAEYGPEASLLTTAAVVVIGIVLWKIPLRSHAGWVLWDSAPPPEPPRAEPAIPHVLN